MRSLVALFFVLLSSSLYGQELVPWADKPANLGQAIGQGALAATSDEPKIVMESIAGCDACSTWLRTDGIDLLEKGWVLKVDRVIPSEGRTYPRWRICFRDGCSAIEYTRDFKSRLRAVISSRNRPQDDFIPAPAGD